MKRTIIHFIVVLVSSIGIWAQASAQPYTSIRPGERWLDTSGRPIQAHAPQIFMKDGVYYWYGENKERTTMGSNVWTWGIRAYRSTDFYNWQDMGLIIEPDTINPLSPLHYSQTLDRPHILYNKATRKWVCWIKSMDTDGYFIVLQADRFEGPYTLVRSFKPEGFGVGDFDMWQDPASGKAYVWFERPHWEMICAELTDDYLGTNGRFSEHFVGIRPPYTREAPTHFMWRGRHYLFTSGTTGYVPNPSQVCVFDDPHGDYVDLGSPHIDDKYEDSFGSQICCVIQIPVIQESSNSSLITHHSSLFTLRRSCRPLAALHLADGRPPAHTEEQGESLSEPPALRPRLQSAAGEGQDGRAAQQVGHHPGCPLRLPARHVRRAGQAHHRVA
ncbi:MAG: family 43 glycosylhydrolase [Prevotella sp.]|nr:family 43 glycosylhydrolase [Prevotella sp.]